MPTTYAELLKSRPARGAWIEMLVWAKGGTYQPRSRPARGAWIEMAQTQLQTANVKSRPARGAWIEITKATEKWLKDNAGRAPQGARGLK